MATLGACLLDSLGEFGDFRPRGELLGELLRFTEVGDWGAGQLWSLH